MQTVFYGIFWADFLFSMASFGYTTIVVFLNNDALGDLAAIIVLGIFFGSDILMAGGMVYLFQNYIPVPPTTTTSQIGQYILLNAQGTPMLYQAQPVFLNQGEFKQQIVMV